MKSSSASLMKPMFNYPAEEKCSKLDGSGAFLERRHNWWKSDRLESRLVRWKLPPWCLFWNISVNPARFLVRVEGCFIPQAEGFPSLAGADAPGRHWRLPGKLPCWWVIVRHQCPRNGSSPRASRQQPAAAAWWGYFCVFVWFIMMH